MQQVCNFIFLAHFLPFKIIYRETKNKNKQHLQSFTVNGKNFFKYPHTEAKKQMKIDECRTG